MRNPIQFFSAQSSLLVDSPDAPSDLIATTNYSVGGRIDLSWTDNSDDETGFKIYQHTANDINGASVVATPAANATSASITGLTNDTLYYFWVKATNAGGDSSESAVASATPRAWLPDITGASFVLESDSGVTLSTADVTLWEDLVSSRDFAATAGQEPDYAADAGFNGSLGSMTFDGSDDKLTTASHADLNVGTGDFILAALVYMNADGVILGKDAWNSAATGYYFQRSTSLRFTTRQAGVSNNEMNGGTFNTGTWYVIMGVRASNVLTSYINNVQAATTSEANGGANTDNSSAFKIGRNDDVSTSMNGKIAAVGLWKVTPTETIRNNIYNRWRNKFLP